MSQAASPARVSPRVELVDAPAHHRPPYLWALASAAALFILYAITLAPSTAFWDTSEYIATAHILGIPHPPGNPLFVLLARAWELLLSPLGLPVAVRINLFSAFMSVGSAFFWYLVVHRILVSFTSNETVRRVGAFASVWVAGTAFTVWNQSNVNEKVYTVTLFTIALMSWIAFLWRDHVEEHRGQKTRLWRDDNAIVLVVFVLALSVGNHLMAFLAAPALFVFLVLVKPRVLGNWKLYPAMAGVAVLGLCVQLYLPIRANQDPVINEAAPKCENMVTAVASAVTLGRYAGDCPDLASALRREQYQKPPMTQRMAPFPAQMANFFQYFDWQWARSLSGRDGFFGAARMPFTMLFLLLGIWGAKEHYARDRKSFWYIAVLFFTLSFGLVYYMNFKYGYVQQQQMGYPDSEVRERDYFYVITFSVWGLWVGVGLTSLWLRLSQALGSGRSMVMAASPVMALALIPLLTNWKYATREGDYAARDFAYNVLQSVEPYGVLITNGDNDTFPLWYLQEVEGIRRDVTVIVMSYFNTPWYVKQLRDITTPCSTPNAAMEDPTRIICQRPFDPSKAPRIYGNPKAPTRPILQLTDVQIEEITNSGGLMSTDDMGFEARGMAFKLPPNQEIYPAHQFVTMMLQSTWGDRPIYFAATTNTHLELGLVQQTSRQGLAYKMLDPNGTAGLLPMPADPTIMQFTGGYFDVQRNVELVERVFMFRNMPERAVWADDATRNIPMQYYYAFAAMATVADMRQDQAGVQKYTQRAEAFQALAQER
ncbi:DUF2723 domain-containing protein [Longimicrobium sp.]|uniref:glycosyltransferase family 117 protein n=1 Tax=Longimicrobium sp. TaxID=2029185 RepID=UPI003B3B9266